MHSWLQQLLGTSVWEATAVLLALAYLLLAVRRSLWCWPCAFAGTAIFLVLFARAHLYMQAVLQLFYIVMSVYGFLEWRRGRAEDGRMAIVSWPARAHVLGAAGVLVATLVNGWVLARFSATAHAPYLDAFVTWASVLTTWMVARRVIENWLYWIVVDIVAAWLYFAQGLTATGLLFLAYIGIVIHGYFVWQRERRAQAEKAVLMAVG